MIFSKEKLADSWGIVISALCAIHCLVLPFVAIASPLTFKFLSSPVAHISLFALLLPISFFAFIKQKKEHQKMTPTILALIGLACLAFGLVAGLDHHDHHHEHGLHTEDLISLAGSAILIMAHMLNIKHLRDCRQCRH